MLWCMCVRVHSHTVCEWEPKVVVKCLPQLLLTLAFGTWSLSCRIFRSVILHDPLNHKTQGCAVSAPRVLVLQSLSVPPGFRPLLPKSPPQPLPRTSLDIMTVRRSWTDHCNALCLFSALLVKDSLLLIHY